MSTLYLGLVGSSLAVIATGLGALPILFVQRITRNAQGVMLGFGAGVMLAATAFSLIVPGLEAALAIAGDRFGAAFQVTLGIVIGGAFLWFSHQYFPHEHFLKGKEGADLVNLKRVWLFVIAIAIHNFPEGLAVGVGFGGENTANGIALAVGIGLQNIPERLGCRAFSTSRALYQARSIAGESANRFGRAAWGNHWSGSRCRGSAHLADRHGIRGRSNAICDQR